MEKAKRTECIRRIIETIKRLSIQQSTLYELAKIGLPDASKEEIDELIFDEYCEFETELYDTCLDEGLLLDDLHRMDLVEGLYYHLDLIVRKILKTQTKPLSLDEIEGIKFSSGGLHQGYNEIVILRTETGFERRIARNFMCGHIGKPAIDLSREQLETLARALQECHVHEWQPGYHNYGVLDGEQWDLQINLTGNRVILTGGSNAYPPCFRDFQKTMLELGEMLEESTIWQTLSN